MNSTELIKYIYTSLDIFMGFVLDALQSVGLQPLVIMQQEVFLKLTKLGVF